MASYKLRNNIFFKTVSVLLALTFSLYNVGYAQPMADTAKPDTSVMSPAAAVKTLSSDDVAVGIDCGTIKSKYAGGTDKIIIHIQDAHCNYEAQQNISKMLEQFTKECGVDMISVEGAEGIVDTSWFKGFPDAEIRKEVANYFMKKGEITGAEFYSITSDYNGTIFGAETREDYIKNLKAFTKTYPYKTVMENYFQDLRGVISRLKAVIYPAKLKEIDLKIKAFKDKEIELSDFARYLYKELSAQKMAFKAYPNFEKLTSTLDYEAKINFDIVDQERSEFIDLLGKKLNKEGMAELITMSLNFKKGHIKAVDFYTYLRDKAKDINVSMYDEYPNLFYYYIYTKLYEGIDNAGLFKEIDQIEAALKDRYFTSDTERTLDRFSTMVDMYVGLISIELTNDDYDLFKEYSPKAGIETIVDFLAQQSRKYNMNYTLDTVPVQISDNIPNMIEFYEVAMKRDRTLIDNTLKEMEKEGKNISVLITGGFHTRGMTNLLEGKGVSYVVVMPKITKDVETPYLQVLTNQRTSLEDILTASATLPGATAANVPGAAKEGTKAAAAEGKMLAPLWRTQLASEFIDEESLQNLQRLSKEIGSATGNDAATVVNNVRSFVDDVVQRASAEWINSLKEKLTADKEGAKNWEKFVNDEAYWNMLISAYLRTYAETSGEKLHSTIEKMIVEKFQGFRRTLVTRSPGSQAAATGRRSSLDPKEMRVMDSAIEATIQSTGSLEEKWPATGGTFVVLDDEELNKNVEKFAEAEKIRPPLDVECHPGTAKTKAFYDPSNHDDAAYSKVERRYYIRKSLYDVLTPVEKDVFARHEEKHILIALGRINVPGDQDEEDFVNAQTGCDVRPIMADKFKSVAHMEQLLMADTVYGTAVQANILAMKKEIAGQELKKNTAKAAELRKELDKFVRNAYERKHNIDSMRSVLTASEYTGYDVIIVNSSTPEEAEYQQKVLEKAFMGRTTGNAAMGNKVCILSVLDEAESGQIIGQMNAWRRAVDMFKDWATANGLEQNSLDRLFEEGKVKIASYHNGGKGERASPATQALGNSRGAQKIVGKVNNALGESLDMELILSVVLETAPLARTNDGARIDTIWTNQIAFGTVDFLNVERTNYLIDKLVVRVPETPKKKDLFDYGTAVLDESGKLVKFLANKTLTKMDADSGKFVDNPDYSDQLNELLSAPKGVFDYGSFTMSREMHYALLKYWRDVRHIFSKIDNEGKTGMSTDIDPTLTQILVPLVNGLEGKGIPEALINKTLGDLESNRQRGYYETAREQVLEAAYRQLIQDMEPGDFKDILVKIYSDPKKPVNKSYVYNTIEFLFLNYGLFSDKNAAGERVLGNKIVGNVDLGENSYWFAYKRLLDMGNEKFIMLSDLTGKVQEIETNGELTRRDASTEDKVMAEDARRMRGIKNDALARFTVNGQVIVLSAQEVMKGWSDPELDISIKGSIIMGSTVLLPGSHIVNSVINDSMGKIVANNSYVETVTSPVINVENSIVLKSVDGNGISANKEIVADAFRPEVRDHRFPTGQTRMRAPIGYDPKGAVQSDTKVFGDNVYSFQQIRDFTCERSVNDAIEREARNKVFYNIVDRPVHFRGMIWPDFGTSGIRGFVTQFPDLVVYAITRGVVRVLKGMGIIGDGIRTKFTIVGDRRPSTERIMRAVGKAVLDEGKRLGVALHIDWGGKVPSPAGAYRGTVEKSVVIVVTGSHIPFDMNGIKFYLDNGKEVLKEHEKTILAGVKEAKAEEMARSWQESLFDERGMFKERAAKEVAAYDVYKNEGGILGQYGDRYVQAFPAGILKGMDIAYWQHSAVGRDVIPGILEKLGAKVERVGRTEKFTAVDTEKVTPAMAAQLKQIADEYKPFSVCFTDGDSDRPGVADEKGNFLTGDKLGLIVTKLLKQGMDAKEKLVVAVPISTNSGVVEALRSMPNVEVVLTKIGSPHVIKAMNDAMAKDATVKTLGWEANGGFLLGSDFKVPGGGVLTALATRDALLPILAAHHLARIKGMSLSKLFAQEIPLRYSGAGAYNNFENDLGISREKSLGVIGDIKKNLSPKLSRTDVVSVNFETNKAEVLVGDTFNVKSVDLAEVYGANYKEHPDMKEWTRLKGEVESLFMPEGFSEVRSINVLDGTRVTFSDNRVAHFRPSGNEPLYRVYFEADTAEALKSGIDIGVTKVIPGAARSVLGITVFPAAAGIRSPGSEAVRRNPMPALPESEKAAIQAIENGQPMVLRPYEDKKPWGRKADGIGEYWYGVGPDGKKCAVAVVAGNEVALTTVMEYQPVALLGEEAIKRFGANFPLEKYLTPEEGTLSAQAHPRKNEPAEGNRPEAIAKNEVWVVMTPGKIVLGFSKDALKTYGTEVKEAYNTALQEYLKRFDELVKAMENNNDYKNVLADLKKADKAADMIRQGIGKSDANLAGIHEAFRQARNDVDKFYNYVEVKEGEVVPIPAGTLHALGQGVWVIEPQIPGSTWRMEDWDTYPIRALDTEKYTELNTVFVEVPETLEMIGDKTTAQVRYERLPGAFEPKGLESHRITMQPNAEIVEANVTSAHNFMLAQGAATVIVTGKNGEVFEGVQVSAVTAGGNALMIPASAKSYKVIAGDRGAQIIDTFVPVPTAYPPVEVTRNEKNGIPGTSQKEYSVLAEFEEYASGAFKIVETVKLTGNNEVPFSDIAGIVDREVKVRVMEGTVRIKNPATGDEKAVELGKYEDVTVPTSSVVQKVGVAPVDLRLEYSVDTEQERAMYAVFETVRKHIPAFKGKKMDILLPEEMFYPGDESKVGSRLWFQKQINTFFEDKDMLKIIPFGETTQKLEDIKSRDEARIILGATKSMFEALEREVKKLPEGDRRQSLTALLNNAGVMAVEDIDTKKGSYMTYEILGIAMLQAVLSKDVIDARSEIALDMKKLIEQLNRSDLKMEALYYLLPYKEAPADLRKMEVAGVSTEIGPFGWMVQVVKNLLIKMPIQPFDMKEQLQNRRKVLWSV